MFGISRIVSRQKRVSCNTINQVRHLYSDEQLNIDKYVESREQVAKFVPNREFFRENLRKRLLSPDYELQSLEPDLKNFLHLFESDKRDIELLRMALQDLLKKRETYEGYNYGFDSVIMRMFHHFQMPDVALEFYQDKVTGQLFKQITSYQILLDLLYKQGKYEDVIRIFENLTAADKHRDHKFINVIIYATFYKMNTSEAYQKALQMWEQNKQGQVRGSRSFVAALALNQNDPETALKIMEGESRYTAMRLISLLAWAQLGRFNEIFAMLQDNISFFKEKNEKVNVSVSYDVMKVIQDVVQHRGLPDDQKRFREINAEHVSLNLVSKKPFDEVISNPFRPERKYKKKNLWY